MVTESAWSGEIQSHGKSDMGVRNLRIYRENADIRSYTGLSTGLVTSVSAGLRGTDGFRPRDTVWLPAEIGRIAALSTRSDP